MILVETNEGEGATKRFIIGGFCLPQSWEVDIPEWATCARGDTPLGVNAEVCVPYCMYIKKYQYVYVRSFTEV